MFVALKLYTTTVVINCKFGSLNGGILPILASLDTNHRWIQSLISLIGYKSSLLDAASQQVATARSNVKNMNTKVYPMVGN